jgi:hypothetical protein
VGKEADLLFLSFGSTVGSLLFIVSGSLVFPYLSLRVRESRSTRPDPQVGLKSVLYAFFSLGILLLLTGLALVVVRLLTEKRQGAGGMSVPVRLGLAWMVAGLVILLFHLLLIKTMTNDGLSLAVRRAFVGWRLAVHSLVVLTTVTILVSILFLKEADRPPWLKTLFGILLVWVPSWVLHIILLSFYSRQLYEPTRVSATEGGP